jgi:hypothetical protein
MFRYEESGIVHECSWGSKVRYDINLKYCIWEDATRVYQRTDGEGSTRVSFKDTNGWFWLVQEDY